MPYQPGSSAVFVNGLLQERSLDDGWVESDPGAGEITLKEAPQGTPTGFPDVLQMFFIDTSPDLPEVVLYRLHGRLRESETLDGRLVALGHLRGAVSELEGLSGHLVGVTSMTGRVDEVERLTGRLVLTCGQC